MARSLCLFELSLVNEPDGERPPRQCVPERLGERQGRAAFEHVGYRNAIGQPFIIRSAGGFERDSRVTEKFAVATEAHADRNLHARA
jgi:hypothetical protein